MQIFSLHTIVHEKLGRSNGGMPDAPAVNARGGRSILRDWVRPELLGQNGELRAVFVHADVCTTHPPFAVESRTPMKDPVIVHH